MDDSWNFWFDGWEFGLGWSLGLFGLVLTGLGGLVEEEKNETAQYGCLPPHACHYLPYTLCPLPS